MDGQTFGTATTGPVFSREHVERILAQAHARLEKTIVEHLPWHELWPRYDRAHTFFYCDPPYWQTAGYGVDFGFEEYERMAALMASCAGKVMVSINDHPDIRACFKGFNIGELKIKYTAGKAEAGEVRRDSGELIITNFETSGGLF